MGVGHESSNTGSNGAVFKIRCAKVLSSGSCSGHVGAQCPRRHGDIRLRHSARGSRAGTEPDCPAKPHRDRLQRRTDTRQDLSVVEGHVYAGAGTQDASERVRTACAPGCRRRSGHRERGGREVAFWRAKTNFGQRRDDANGQDHSDRIQARKFSAMSLSTRTPKAAMESATLFAIDS